VSFGEIFPVLVPVLAGGVFVLAFLAAHKYFLGKRGYPSLRALVADVGPILHMKGEIESPFGLTLGRLAPVRFAGELESGRKARVTFLSEGDEGPEYVRLAVAIEGAPDLTVTEGDDEARRAAMASGYLTEITIQDQAFDDRFYIRGSGDGASATKALRGAFGRVVEEAFDQLSAVEVTVGGGEIALVARASKLEVERYRDVLAFLERGARAFERVALPVRDPEVRRVHADVAGNMRCAYCHDRILGGQEIVTCGLCSTVLHDACLRELGRCPVLGCGSKLGDEPGRARP
jgi:hypothetical protein